MDAHYYVIMAKLYVGGGTLTDQQISLLSFHPEFEVLGTINIPDHFTLAHDAWQNRTDATQDSSLILNSPGTSWYKRHPL